MELDLHMSRNTWLLVSGSGHIFCHTVAQQELVIVRSTFCFGKSLFGHWPESPSAKFTLRPADTAVKCHPVLSDF